MFGFGCFDTVCWGPDLDWGSGLPEVPQGGDLGAGSAYSGDGSSVISSRPDSLGSLPGDDAGGTVSTGSDVTRAPLTETEISLDDRSAGRYGGWGEGSVELEEIGGGTQSTGSAMQSELDFLIEGDEGQSGGDVLDAGLGDDITSAYSGDSYHGTYTDTESTIGTSPDLPAAGDMEMQQIDPDEIEAKMGEVPEGDTFDPGFKTAGEGPASSAPSFVDSDGSPLLLGDIPDDLGSAFSWEMIDPDMIPADLMPAFTESLSDMSNLSLGAEGVGSSMGGLLGFAKNRAVDLIGGQLMMPVFSWLDDATGTPWVSRSIQGTLAMYGLLAGGDPFGVIAAPIGWGIQEYIKQRERLIANKDPEAEMGKKFAYVREGDKWYPAIQTSKERDEGWIGSNKTQVSFQ